MGDGKERQPLQELAQTLGVADRVLFVGRKPAGFRFLQLADIFVMPSYSEGFPLAMLEAASMQKAIVCSDIPVFREIFSEQEIVTFELDNTNSLRDALITARREKEKLALMYIKNILNPILRNVSTADILKSIKVLWNRNQIPSIMSNRERTIESKGRIEFIDLAKGICILLVVMIHVGVPEYIPGLYAAKVPIFFLLSGLFFLKKVNFFL